MKAGDKIASDDYCAVGILTNISGKLYVVGDFGKVEFEDYCADWVPYSDWLAKIDIERANRNKRFKKLLRSRAKTLLLMIAAALTLYFMK